jgi:hypothetical protein
LVQAWLYQDQGQAAEWLRDKLNALERETAASEILKIISSSQSSVQPTLDAIAANAALLCGRLTRRSIYATMTL